MSDEKDGKGGQLEPEAEGAEGLEMKDEVRDFLGKKLRAHYQGLVQEPLPDKFTKLLAELSKRNDEPKKGS